ncbi:MAG TPA: alpha/beta hydrolase, partial [Thermodesulfobacteriota bacterium]|nr:alpha/beta hydrolase [Thermodesulfobacteriota bacterium]
MMIVTREGVRIYYYVQGEGEPLLLIRGYANSAAMWYPQVPWLSAHFQVITLDNRDTGNSDRVTVPYNIVDMAGDVIALIEHLNRGAVHLLGISMGGMIAQQVTLLRPDLVKSIILGCTTCNHGTGLTTDPKVLELFAPLPELSDEANVRRSLPVFFSPRTLKEKPDMIEEFIKINLAQRPPLETFVRHAQAMKGFQVCDQLNRITTPTLIQHGGGDLLIPFSNSEEIKKRMPQARLMIYEG